jgi:streptogramin lyase/tRNA A-37 threonylcarbamoyl transferase component Bud32
MGSWTPSSDLRAGAELLGYRIERVLGRGGMSVVYLAEDLHLKRRVALKLLAPPLTEDEAFRERFLEESQLAASLDHPNVVPIYTAGESGDELYIAMRYVKGQDLKVLLRGGALPPERAIRICSQVAEALDFAHERGLVHRDVKPSNVLLDPSEHVYLADFGLTKRLGEGRTAEPALFGTIDYIAPEQIRGEEIDRRADVYALGCLLYECLVGSAPFRRGSDAATLFAHLEEDPPPLPGLDEVLSRGLAKEPEERQQTCGELIDEAREALGIAAPAVHRTRLLAAAAAFVAIAAAAALLAVFLTRGGGSASAGLDGRLLRIDPASNRVVGSTPVGDGADAVAVGDGRVWVASYRDGTLWQLDARSGAVRSVPALGRPHDVTIHAGRAYVAALGPSTFGGNVTQFDAVSGGRTGGIPKFTCSLTSGSYGVWIAGCPDVYELTVDGSNVAAGAKVTIPFPAQLNASNYREGLGAMAMGEGAVWAIGDASDPTLWRIDPRRHRIASTIHLGFPPAHVAAGEGAVWVTDQLHDRVVEVDPATNRVVRSIRVGRGAAGVAVGAGSVWVTGAIDHSVTRIDPPSGRAVGTIPVAASPQAVAVGDEGVWVVGDAR